MNNKKMEKFWKGLPKEMSLPQKVEALAKEVSLKMDISYVAARNYVAKWRKND